jgi:DNA-binding MarR family transcriptional regulator
MSSSADDERECTPRDSVDALIDSWTRRRPDLDFSPVAIVTRLTRVREHIAREQELVFERLGLTAPSFEALVTLARIGGESGVSQRELADALGLTSGTVSVRVDQLVDRGRVARARNPDSKRASLVTLTEQGQAVFQQAAPVHLRNEARLLAGLSGDERELLAELLRKLLVEFEGSAPIGEGVEGLGLVLAPAHVTIQMRQDVGLPQTPGLLVRSVQPDSRAASAGISAGDVLVEANGRELRSSSALYAAARANAGRSMKIRVARGSRNREVTIDLGPKHTLEPAAAIAARIARDHSI